MFKIPPFGFHIKVWIPGLILFETRQDKTGGNFPNWQDCDKTTCVWSCCSGNSRLLRCITARGSSVGLSRASPTKVETNKYSYMLEYKCKRPDHVLAIFSTAKFVGDCFKMVQNQQTLLHDKSFQKFWLRKLTKLCKVLKCYFISFQWANIGWLIPNHFLNWSFWNLN